MNGVLMAENINGRFIVTKDVKSGHSSIGVVFNTHFSDQEMTFVQNMPVNE